MRVEFDRFAIILLHAVCISELVCRIVLQHFEAKKASSHEELDALLVALLAKHSEGDDRWNAYLREFNSRPVEEKSKMWSKSRAKKIKPAQGHA